MVTFAKCIVCVFSCLVTSNLQTSGLTLACQPFYYLPDTLFETVSILHMLIHCFSIVIYIPSYKCTLLVLSVLNQYIINPIHTFNQDVLEEVLAQGDIAHINLSLQIPDEPFILDKNILHDI